MVGQEKITVNLNAVDLAKVDYLAGQGFYGSRSDFIRTAIRNQLREHDAVISDTVLTDAMKDSGDGVKSIGGIGVIHLGRGAFEKHLREGTKLKLFIVGSLFIDGDVTLDLVEEVVESSGIYGVLKGPDEVTTYLRELKQR